MTAPDHTASNQPAIDPMASTTQVPPQAPSPEDTSHVLDGDGFHVDLDALSAASIGITQTLKDMDQCKIRGICGEPEQYGHQGIHDVFANFCGRWQQGVDVLLEDAKSLRDGLNQAADAYARGDANAAVVPTNIEKIMGD
jgi:hypothetical protein